MLTYIYKKSLYLDGVEINKEYASLIENDTLSVCKESQKDKRVFISTESFQRSANTITTSSPSSTSTSSQHIGKPIIYFVTPTYPR